tara:strand:- start:259 stop:753 length:495 start_codon:yes stop_codon:yes gene_type:complete
MVSIDNIFGLFSHDSDDLSNNKTSYEDLKTSPVYYVGMYKKLILNHINFNKKVLHFFKQSNDELNVEDIKEAGEYVTYNRAWGYIKNVDLNEISHIDALKYYSDEYLDTSLQLGINYFTQTEEYERCAALLKIMKIVKNFPSKVGDEKSSSYIGGTEVRKEKDR